MRRFSPQVEAKTPGLDTPSIDAPEKNAVVLNKLTQQQLDEFAAHFHDELLGVEIGFAD